MGGLVLWAPWIIHLRNKLWQPFSRNWMPRTCLIIFKFASLVGQSIWDAPSLQHIHMLIIWARSPMPNCNGKRLLGVVLLIRFLPLPEDVAPNSLSPLAG